MIFETKNKIGARFQLKVHKGDGVAIRESEWFDNIVLDSGLARMSVDTWIDRCCVGTGNTEPLASQVSLSSFRASTLVKQAAYLDGNTSVEPYYWGGTIVWRFGAGLASGNLSEVGLGWGNFTLWNRALIRDNAGNPTTITVLSGEFLDVTATVRVYPEPVISGAFNLMDKNNNIISGHTYTGIPCITRYGEFYANKVSLTINSYTGSMGEGITTSPNGTETSWTSQANTFPTGTSLQCVASLSLSQGNLSHQSFKLMPNIMSFSGNKGGYKLQIDPPISKNSSQSLEVTFVLSWGRYEPT